MRRRRKKLFEKRKQEKVVTYHYDNFLTIQELSKALRLDRRTIEGVAYDLGGRRFGNRWRFHWGTVVEYFRNANTETGRAPTGQTATQ